MSTRTAILEAAALLLAESPVADVSTRAVCEAAGVGAPVLYRQFGDKEGLLAAMVDHGFERYLAVKRSAEVSTDPVRDLRDGWDRHVEFALANPHVYRLMYSPAVTGTPAAAVEAHGLLLATLRRVAGVGALRVAPETAARMVMAANVGLALLLVARPDLYTEPGLSHRVREAVFGSILTEPRQAVSGVPAAAVRLAELLRDSPGLTPNESALMTDWLTRLARGATDEGETP